jgi:hypothetical protein
MIASRSRLRPAPFGLSLWQRAAHVVLILAFAATAVGATPSSAQASGGAAFEATLTNEEVIQLVRLGLGEEVLVAKIKQAPRVDFRLDTAGLVALKNAGISDKVMAAMLDRSSAKPSDAAPMMAGPFGGSSAQAASTDVMLRTSEGDLPLSAIRGDLSHTWAYVATLTFLDYPGVRARNRATDRQPSILVASNEDPIGRLYLANLDPDKGDNTRSLKMGKARMFGSKQISTPDNDWTIPFQAEEIQRGAWKLTPTSALKPGEYGLWVRPGWSFPAFVAGDQGALFDFGID